MAAEYVEFTSVERCGVDVVIARLSRPEGYAFSAGQWFRLTLETDQRPATRTLSHAGAPTDQGIEFATRLSDSAFKRTLANVSPGDAATVVGPGGRPCRAAQSRRITFLTGGVGITPVRSIVRAAVLEGGGFDDALILYGNRDQSCVPFGAELAGFGAAGVRLVNVFETAPDGFDGETGFITAEMVERTGGAAAGRAFFVSGPPPMVAAMTGVLDALGVSTEDRCVESFGV